MGDVGVTEHLAGIDVLVASLKKPHGPATAVRRRDVHGARPYGDVEIVVRKRRLQDIPSPAVARHEGVVDIEKQHLLGDRLEDLHGASADQVARIDPGHVPVLSLDPRCQIVGHQHVVSRPAQTPQPRTGQPRFRQGVVRIDEGHVVTELLENMKAQLCSAYVAADIENAHLTSKWTG